MLRTSTITFLLLLAVLPAKSGIDLTPSATEYLAEGIKYQQLTFKHDKQRIEYEPPQGWSFRGDSSQFSLTPPKKNFAEAVIESAPLATPQPLDEKAIKAFEQRCIANLPVGSQFVTVVSQEQNAILLNGNGSVEVSVSYQLMGEKFLRSTLFVNLPDTQLIFRLTAQKDDFQSLHREFKRSLFSWHWVETEQTGQQPAASQPAQQAPLPR